MEILINLEILSNFLINISKFIKNNIQKIFHACFVFIT